MDNKAIDQWARAALHATGHSDQQIEAMKKPKPKLATFLPNPIPMDQQMAYAAKWTADHNARKATAKAKKESDDKLSHARAKLAEMAEEKETWETRAETLEDQLSALMKRQGR
jgi:hypothetical protein